MYIALLLSLLSASFGITCDIGESWVQVRKRNGSVSPAEESWVLYADSVEEVVSGAYARNEDRTNEYCLPTTSFDQYEIEFRDQYGDSWDTLSFVEVYGKNGNTFFKQIMHHSVVERYPLSLYSPINKDTENMYFSASLQDGFAWTELSYTPSAAWSTVTLGSVSATTTGPQFFRKPFLGLANLAAYELSMYYKDGIVAYLNGQEIYRDNMPVGTVAGTTLASGTYSAYGYRGMVGNGYNIRQVNNVVAFSLHFLTADSENSILFNLFVSQYAKSFSDTASTKSLNCWVVAETPSITASVSGSPSSAMNWGKLDYFYATATALPVDLIFQYNGLTRYNIIGFETFPYQYKDNAPKDFTLYGSTTTGSGVNYVRMYDGIEVAYTNGIWVTEQFTSSSSFFQQLKLTLRASRSTYCYVYEFHPAVCNAAPITTFSYPLQTVYANMDTIFAVPSVSGISQCTSNNLPNGVTVDYDTCILSGMPTQGGSGSYQIVATYPSELTGTISINALICSGNILRIERIYGVNASNELFTISNADTNEEIYDEAASTVQVAGATRSTGLCVNADRVKIVTASSSLSYWYVNSYLQIYMSIADDQEEILLRTRYDSNIGVNPINIISIKQQIPSSSTWKYSFVSSAPSATWFESISTWTDEGVRGSFPSANNQYQLYGRTFSVTAAELANAAAFIMHIRYQYGIVVYLNGHEAFRNFVASTGGLDVITAATASYSALLYRTISLPTTFMSSDPQHPGARLIQAGTNTVAIGLVAPAASYTTSNFDAVFRLFGDVKSDRILDFDSFFSGQTGGSGYLTNKYYANYNYYTTCGGSNWYQIQYRNDRREWISSFAITNYYASSNMMDSPQKFLIQAKNAADSDWTLLYEATGDWKWWVAAQTKKSVVYNNKPYNMYRVANIGTGNPTSCTWRMSEWYLFAEKTDLDVDDLTYTPSSHEAFLNIELAEIFPDQEGFYSGFSVTPPFPTGIFIDPPSGVIGGTPTSLSDPQYYEIRGMRANGIVSSFNMTFQVIACANARTLITFVIRTDSNPAAQGWKLFQGKEADDSMVMMEKVGFPAVASLYYIDLCLDYAFYTAQFFRPQTTGWNFPSVWSIAVDTSGLLIDLGSVASMGTSPSFANSVFSSFLPFQMIYTKDWQVLYSDAAEDDNWKLSGFTASSSWETMAMETLAEKTNVMRTTVYIRHTFTISTVNEYPVMNFRARFNGGIAVYLNGKRFARFNLPDVVGDSTEAVMMHDEEAPVKFHVILLTEGGVNGENVIAFEHHRAAGLSSSVPHIFDSTATFGVDSCNLLSDTVINVNPIAAAGIPWSPMVGWRLDPFDHDPLSYMSYTNTVGYSLEFEIANLDRPRWNGYFILSGYAQTGHGWTFSGKQKDYESWNELDSVLGVNTQSLTKNRFATSMGMVGFRFYRFTLDVAGSSNLMIMEFGFEYCHVSGEDICSQEDEYPAVAEGEYSPGDCGMGYTGFTRRLCDSGSLGVVDRGRCVYKEIQNLAYAREAYEVVKNTNVSIPSPTYDNIVTEFYLDDSDLPLPSGLSVDAETGEIRGVPLVEQSFMQYTIRAQNPSGVVITTLWMGVRKGKCPAEGVYPAAFVGETVAYDCANEGDYVGTKTRVCQLGEVDGEWGDESGTCTSSSGTNIVLVIIAVIVTVVVFIIRLFWR